LIGKFQICLASLLLSWLEMGALLAILFRLSSTFELIASTQRELRRAIHQLGERRAAELGTCNASGGPCIALASSSPLARAGAVSTIGPDDMACVSPAVNP
jgi:hypothetical protein